MRPEGGYWGNGADSLPLLDTGGIGDFAMSAIVGLTKARDTRCAWPPPAARAEVLALEPKTATPDE